MMKSLGHSFRKIESSKIFADQFQKRMPGTADDLPLDPSAIET
jgi:hypothetical protein